MGAAYLTAALAVHTALADEHRTATAEARERTGDTAYTPALPAGLIEAAGVLQAARACDEHAITDAQILALAALVATEAPEAPEAPEKPAAKKSKGK